MLLGGPPFREQLVMWWNFVGRSHEDIAAYRQQWENHDARFGAVAAIAALCHGCPRRRCRTPRCVRGRTPGYRGGMTTDKTGAPTTVTKERTASRIAVDGSGRRVPEIVDRDGRRNFPHTEVDDGSGRGLATILIGEALQQTRDAGLRIVPVCPMVADYVKKHPEFDDVVDAAVLAS